MSIHESININQYIDDAMKTEEPTDICRFYHKQFNKIAVLNKQELQQQFTDFRNTGMMKIEDYNNQTIKRNKRKFYVLVVQHIDEEKDSICPMSLLGYGFMVSGFPYYFDSKKDRDFAISIFKNEKNDKKKKKKLIIKK